MEKLHVITGEGANHVQEHVQNALQERMDILAAGLKIPDLHPDIQDAYIENMAEVSREATAYKMPTEIMHEHARLFTKGDNHGKTTA